MTVEQLQQHLTRLCNDGYGSHDIYMGADMLASRAPIHHAFKGELGAIFLCDYVPYMNEVF